MVLGSRGLAWLVVLPCMRLTLVFLKLCPAEPQGSSEVLPQSKKVMDLEFLGLVTSLPLFFFFFLFACFICWCLT